MQESQTAQSNTGLIYGLNDRPPVREAIFAAIQHLLAIFVAIITPPLIIAGALKLDLETTSFLVSMSLFASGISTFIQCRRIGGIGTGLLCIQGTSFSFIGPIISAGMLGGLPLIFGTCIVASSVEMVISRILNIPVNNHPSGIGHCSHFDWNEPDKSRYHSLWRRCFRPKQRHFRKF